MTKVYKLSTRTLQKSYYGKATVIVYDDKIMVLKSYDTLVASFNIETKELRVLGTYSQTTLKHIKSFMFECGMVPGTKKDILDKYHSGNLHDFYN